MYKISKKPDQVYELNLNVNCPDSEKVGSGPGSCGGATKDEKSTSSTPDAKDKAKDPLKAPNVTIYPKDLSTMNKKMQREYLKDVIRGKTFKRLREEQDLVGQQIEKVYPKAIAKDPVAELAMKNLQFHNDMLMQAVQVMSFDDNWNKKIYEEATGTSWDKRPKDKKPKKGSDNFGL
jgi:hypothetical protein